LARCEGVRHGWRLRNAPLEAAVDGRRPHRATLDGYAGPGV
jgi:hypothetical protein